MINSKNKKKQKTSEAGTKANNKFNMTLKKEYNNKLHSF